MKRIFFIFALLSTGLLFAQSASNPDTDTTVVDMGNSQMVIIENEEGKQYTIKIREDVDENSEMTMEDNDGDDKPKKKKNVDVGLFAMDLGMNMFLLDGSNANLPAQYEGFETNTFRSTHVGLHFFPTRINLIKHHVNLETSLDLDILRANYQNSYTLQPKTPTVMMTPDSIEYSKNRLQANYAQIPLLLNFQTSPDNKKKNFRLSVGGYGGFLIASSTKQKSEEQGKVVIKDDFNLEKFRYGVTARVGFRRLELYGNYNLSTLFRDGQDPALVPLSMGVRIVNLH